MHLVQTMTPPTVTTKLTRGCLRVPAVRLTGVLPASRSLNWPGAFRSYQSFLTKGSTLEKNQEKSSRISSHLLLQSLLLGGSFVLSEENQNRPRFTRENRKMIATDLRMWKISAHFPPRLKKEIRARNSRLFPDQYAQSLVRFRCRSVRTLQTSLRWLPNSHYRCRRWLWEKVSKKEFQQLLPRSNQFSQTLVERFPSCLAKAGEPRACRQRWEANQTK